MWCNGDYRVYDSGRFSFLCYISSPYLHSPAHCAAAKGALESVKMLEAKDGDVWQQNKRGEYPIHEASLSRQTGIYCEYLLEGVSL